ncbi:hypothetical protein XC93_10755 [Klebsiella variicola]|nr:hypothetical protein [Klebsiella variicola]MDT7025546.1 hypothetical protein [Klebsiella variicola]
MFPPIVVMICVKWIMARLILLDVFILILMQNKLMAIAQYFIFNMVVTFKNNKRLNINMN